MSTQKRNLEGRQRTIAPEALASVWSSTGYRVFLSHKAEAKKETAELKVKLGLFGVSAFVAHADIPPTKAWQDEIENALMSMDAFVALLTEDFHESDWTDQEVGFAVGRRVPLISVKLGRNPYGFIGKFQGLLCTWDEAPIDLAKLLINEPRMVDAYIAALPQCRNFNEGNTLSKVLPSIKKGKLTINQVDKMISAFNLNSELRHSRGFNGADPRWHGDGLEKQLSRITRFNYRTTSSGEIERVATARNAGQTGRKPVARSKTAAN